MDPKEFAASAPVALVMRELLRGDGYGLSLQDRIAESTGVKLGQSIYHSLRSLERYGLLRSYELRGGPERGGRPQIWYTLTEAGRSVAERNGVTTGKGK